MVIQGDQCLFQISQTRLYPSVLGLPHRHDYDGTIDGSPQKVVPFFCLRPHRSAKPQELRVSIEIEYLCSRQRVD